LSPPSKLGIHNHLKAHDRNRTDDLILTKDVLCRLSYMGKSGKRDSNPRPSAWKADALPLSYSREQQMFIITQKKYLCYKHIPVYFVIAYCVQRQQIKK